MKKKKLTFIKKIQAYHMMPNLTIAMLLLFVNLLSLILYICFSGIRNSEIWSNIFIAVITGLLATILSTASYIFIEFKNNERGELLEDIYSFGIIGLSQKKGEVLELELEKCRKTIWISGYRLILTERLKESFAKAVRKGAEVKVVVCPPWLSGFKMVYGEKEEVLDNYFKVFHELLEAAKQSKKDLVIHFSEKPLFSDTYRIDDRFVTGPYLHNKDNEFHRIMANDFFTYIVNHGSPLHNLVEEEYDTLFIEAESELDLDKFDQAWEEYSNRMNQMSLDSTYTFSESDKIKIMQNAIK